MYCRCGFAKICTNKITYNADSKLKALTAHLNDKDNGFVEFIYFIEGDTSYFVEGEYYKLAPGDIVFSNPIEIHGIVHQSPCIYKRLLVTLTRDFFVLNDIEHLYDVFCNKYPGEGNFISHSSDLGKIIGPMFGQLTELTSDGSPDSRKDNILTEIIKVIALEIKCFRGEIPNPLLRKIIAYIVENYNQDIGLNSLAEMFYINRTHLARIFKQLTNCSVNQFITILRFNRIYQFMYYSKMSLGDAVKKAGYKNYSTFYRAYKKYYGHAPGENDDWYLSEYKALKEEL